MKNYLRLSSGVVMFVFVLMHLANLSLGIVSLDAMNDGTALLYGPWRILPGSPLLLAAFLVHFGLALWSLYERQTLRLQRWEITQYILGLLIPVFLIGHLMECRLAETIWGVRNDYTEQLLIRWSIAPKRTLSMMFLLIIVWTHSYIGLRSWFRLKPWYSFFQPLMSGFFIVFPTVALAGYVTSGMQVRALSVNAIWVAGVREESGLSEEVFRSVLQIGEIGVAGYLGLIAVVLVARQIRVFARSRSGGVKLRYDNKREVFVALGETVLDALGAAGVRHASICGGKGRCSTCRVRVGRGLDQLDPPSMAEQRVLSKISAAPNVRLACQIRPSGDLEVTPLLVPSVTPEAGFRQPSYLKGEEREVAILFADIQDFTGLSEEKLPYDVVFILNSFFREMGTAIEDSGGRVIQLIGDEVMALFGLEFDAREGCRRALSAARLMARKLDELNESLRGDVRSPLRIGIGIHVGNVIVGKIGYREFASTAAVGDAVNTASRLQNIAKEFNVQLVVSEGVVEKAAADMSPFGTRNLEVRGRVEPLKVRIIGSALELDVDERH